MFIVRGRRIQKVLTYAPGRRSLPLHTLMIDAHGETIMPSLRHPHRLVPGARADFLLIIGDPAPDVLHAERVVMAWRNGLVESTVPSAIVPAGLYDGVEDSDEAITP